MSEWAGGQVSWAHEPSGEESGVGTLSGAKMLITGGGESFMEDYSVPGAGPKGQLNIRHWAEP